MTKQFKKFAIVVSVLSIGLAVGVVISYTLNDSKYAAKYELVYETDCRNDPLAIDCGFGGGGCEYGTIPCATNISIGFPNQHTERTVFDTKNPPDAKYLEHDPEGYSSKLINYAIIIGVIEAILVGLLVLRQKTHIVSKLLGSR